MKRKMLQMLQISSTNYFYCHVIWLYNFNFVLLYNLFHWKFIVCSKIFFKNYAHIPDTVYGENDRKDTRPLQRYAT